MATPPESCSKPRPSAFRKTGLHPCVFKPQTTRRWEPPFVFSRANAGNVEIPYAFQPKTERGTLPPHSCFLEQVLAMLRYPMRSSRKRSVEPSLQPPAPPAPSPSPQPEPSRARPARPAQPPAQASPGHPSPAPLPCPSPSPRCKMWFQKKNVIGTQTLNNFYKYKIRASSRTWFRNS